MVRISTLAAAFAVLLAISGCAMTEIPMAHENPLDRIYDSGNFRLVLTAEATSATSTGLTWSNIYQTTDGEVSDTTMAITTTANVYRSAGAPSATDLDSVKRAGSLSGAFTQINSTECPVKLVGSSYAGSCAVTSTPKGYFIIQFNYKYTGKSNPASGILYSNFVAVQ